MSALTVYFITYGLKLITFLQIFWETYCQESEMLVEDSTTQTDITVKTQLSKCILHCSIAP